MAKQLGTGSTLEWTDDAGVTYTEVNNITNISFSITNDEVDSTDNDDAGYKSNLAGDQQLTMSVDGNYDEQAGLSTVINAAENKTSLGWRFRNEVTSGKNEYTFDSKVFEFTDTDPHGDVIAYSFSLASSGSVSVSAQS